MRLIFLALFATSALLVHGGAQAPGAGLFTAEELKRFYSLFDKYPDIIQPMMRWTFSHKEVARFVLPITVRKGFAKWDEFVDDLRNEYKFTGPLNTTNEIADAYVDLYLSGKFKLFQKFKRSANLQQSDQECAFGFGLPWCPW